jgi:hypothetical protein
MRRASNNYGLLINNDKFIGISLGYDYCAEHEWGIKELRTLCAIPDSSKKNMGVLSRTITKCPENLIFKEEIIKKIKYALLYTGYRYGTIEEAQKNIPHAFKNFVEDLKWVKKWNDEHPNRECKDSIITAWDGSSFGVAVMGDKEVGYLKELYDAFLNKNVSIAVINHRAINPFAGTALSLMITNRLPQEILDMMYAGDKEYFDREDYEEKIGMKEIIEKYGNKNGYNGNKYFMACSPKWIDYNDVENREIRKKELNTKYDIHYWINYSDNDNNSGWYTVEEIKEWLTGKKKLTEIRKG